MQGLHESCGLAEATGERSTRRKTRGSGPKKRLPRALISVAPRPAAQKATPKGPDFGCTPPSGLKSDSQGPQFRLHPPTRPKKRLPRPLLEAESVKRRAGN